MIERDQDSIRGGLAEGRIGLSPCRLACPGCPETVRPEALQVRLVGVGPDVEARARALLPRFVEIASGELPTDPDVIARWKEAGIRRLLVPVLGSENVHDRRAGVPGAYRAAIGTLDAARRAGLEAQLLVPAPRAGFEGLGRTEFEALRAVMRLGWQHNARVRWYEEPAPPCIASNPE